MKFGKRYTKITVLMAMLHGVIIGIAAVAVIGLVLFATKGKDNINASNQEVPASGPAPVEAPVSSAEKPIRLFAKQHGAFSTAAAASAFIAEDPSLSKAAIVQANDQYFVWSAIGLKEGDIISNANEETYRKAFTVDTLACGAVGAGKLHDIITATEIGQINDLIDAPKTENADEKIKEFQKNVTAITGFTKDLQLIRLQLLSHYSYTEKCVKIAF